MKIFFAFFLSISLISCASVNSRGEYEFKGAESTARAVNAAGGAAMGLAAGLAVGKPLEGAAAGAFVGVTKDPNECSEGYVDAESADAPIAGANGGAPGEWRGTAHRDHNKRCGNRRGGGWFGSAPMGRDVGRTSYGGSKNLPYCDQVRVMPGWQQPPCIMR